MSNEQNYTPNIDTLIKNVFKPTAAKAEGSCPLKAPEIAIYPVRYAINENPLLESLKTKTDLPLTAWDTLSHKQTNYSLPPKGTPFTQLPELNTREYTLRQLRKGWLYIWTEENEWEEYEITPPTKIGQLTTFKKIDINQAKDTRPATGKAEHALYFKPTQSVYMAYSSVQWTQRIIKEAKETPTHTHMRLIKLPEFIATMSAPHAQQIDVIDQYVADIFKDKADTTFNSTMVTNLTTQATEDGFKREQTISIPKAELIAALKDPTSALFIALDDDLAIINDLLLNTTYPISAQEIYEHENQRKTNIAQILYPMAGMAIDEFIPDEIAKDPITKYEYLRDLSKVDYLEHARIASVNSQHERVTGETAAPWEGFESSANDKAWIKIANKWGQLPKQQTKTDTWQGKLNKWQKTRLIRRNISLPDIFEHLRARAEILKKLAYAIQLTIQDLTVWLDRLKIDTLKGLFHDLENIDQSSELHKYANNILNYIQYDQKGIDWAKQQLSKPSTLFGHAFFHFNREIYQFFAQIGEQIAKSGDLKTTDFEYSSVTDWGYLGFDSIDNYISVLDNPKIKASKYYATLSKPAQAAYEAYCHMIRGPLANFHYERNIKTLAHLIQTAEPETIATHALMATVTSSDTNKVVINKQFASQFKEWANKLITLHKERKYLADENKRLGKKEVAYKAKNKTYPEAEKRQDRARIAENRKANKKLKNKIKEIRAQKPVAIVADNSVINYSTHDYFYLRSGQAELFKQHTLGLESKLKRQQQAQRFAESMKGSKLPLLMTLWNAYNVYNDIEDEESISAITSDIFYANNALANLWMAPLWQKYYGIKVQFKTSALKQNSRLPETASLAELTIKDIQQAKFGYVKFAGTARTYRQVVNAMSQRIAFVNLLVTVGAFSEMISLWDDARYASTIKEGIGQVIKLGSLGATSIAGVLGAAGWMYSSLWGITLTLGPTVNIAFLVAGLAYLASSIWIEFFHREGIALWADQSIWGNIKKWGDGVDEQSQLDELSALHKVLLHPEVKIKQTVKQVPNFNYRYAYNTTGFWLQIAFPKELEGCQLQLNTLVVYPRLGIKDLVCDDIYTSRIGKNGFWSNPKDEDEPLTDNPEAEGTATQPDYDYDEAEPKNCFIYNVWIPYKGIIEGSYLDLEICYPFDFSKKLAISDQRRVTYSFIYEVNLFNKQIYQHSPVDIEATPLERVKDEKEASTYIKSGNFNSQIKQHILTVGEPDQHNKPS